MQLKSKLVLLLVITALFVGCKKEDSPTSPTGNNNTGGNQSGQPMPGFADSANVNGVMVTISYEMATIPGMPSVQMVMAFSTFGDNGVDAGEVKVNNNVLGKITSSGSTYYMVPNPSNPTQTISNVSFNGSVHNWTVVGGNGIPALTGGVTSPSTFNITSPAANATVTKSSGIQVTWNGGTNSKLMIVLASTTGNGYFSTEELADNGTYTIPAAQLANISGQALLQVVKYRYAEVTSSGKSYFMIAEIVKNVTVTVQ